MTETAAAQAIPENLSYHEKRYFLAEYYKENLFDFARDVLGFSLLTESQRRWEKHVTDSVDFSTLLTQTSGQKFVMYQMPRETYKSTFFTVSLAVWALLKEPDLAILITSAANSNSKAWLSLIQKKMETEMFRMLYGDIRKPFDWRDSDITISTRVRARAEASITCAGKDSIITAKHFDLILCDDLVNQNDRDSPAERIKSIRYVDDIVDLLNKQYGVGVFTGTTWHYKDAHQYIEKELNLKLRAEKRAEIKIYKEPVYEDIDGQRVYNFPEIYPAERCEEVRSKKSDISNFAANYLLKPLHPKSQIFQEESLQFYEYGTDFPKNLDSIAVHIDPSSGDKETSDYTAAVAVGKRKSDGRLLVLDTRIEQVRPSGREELIYSLFEYYRKQAESLKVEWQIETVANQEEIKRSLIAFMLQKGIADFSLRGKGRVANKIAKITTLELPISNGSLLFRRDWQTASGNYRTLIYQLLEFPLGHDDAPDALKEAVDLCEKKGQPKIDVF